MLDRKGQLRHHGGVVDAPGLYVLGLPFLRRRKSSFIHGVDDDARELSAHLVAWLARGHRQRARTRYRAILDGRFDKTEDIPVAYCDLDA
ncbi:hypothetical protein [Halomonas sp.]|uniref:hypothetical protein n=1 Tax=Halomonas sp. TaxID=1486246 RepID=UPI00298E7BCB|nr:hypothetical protein [Halomonas sp.]MDW7748352.1 hypothetical protein [Halomonas sp.]